MNSNVPFSRDEYSTRVKRTTEALQKAGVDVVIAFANKVLPGHVRYLSGYETRHGIHDWSMFLLESKSSRCALLTNVSWESIGEVSWVPDVRLTSLPKAGSVIREWMPSEVKTIGIAGYNAFPAPLYRSLRESFAQAEVLDASRFLFEVRQVKSPAEIAVMRECAKITDVGARTFQTAAREGQRERDILAEVESAMKKAGSDEVSFSTQVGSGPRTATICPYATDRRLSDGDLVQLDCGATYCGYRGDISRIAIIGKPSPRQRAFLDVTAEMYDAMVKAIRPGITAAKIAAIGVGVGKSHGLEDCLYRSPNHDVGFMGHSMGCNYHEPPEINPEDQTVLQEGMIIVVEPILSEAGVGGAPP